MNVGISQLILGTLPVEEFLSQSAQAGYEVVELCMKNDGDLTPRTGNDDLQKIADQAAGHGVAIASMTHSHCTGNLLDSGEAQRTSIEQTVQGLEIAAKLGVRCTLHTLGRFTTVHLKDWKGGALNGGWTPLLEGEVDFAAMNHELRAIGYDGPMISEVEPALAPIDKTAKAIRTIIAM